MKGRVLTVAGRAIEKAAALVELAAASCPLAAPAVEKPALQIKGSAQRWPVGEHLGQFSRFDLACPYSTMRGSFVGGALMTSAGAATGQYMADLAAGIKKAEDEAAAAAAAGDHAAAAKHKNDAAAMQKKLDAYGEPEGLE